MLIALDSRLSGYSEAPTCQDVFHLNCPLLQYGAASHSISVDRQSLIDLLLRHENRTPVGNHLEHAAVHARDRRIVGLAQARRAFCHGIQYGLDIGRRARDHAQDFAGSGLLFKCLADLAIALLHFVEQPRIFEGHAHAAGECFQQPDIGIAEGVLTIQVLDRYYPRHRVT